MKRWLWMVCLLWVCWAVQPAPVAAALEEIPLPPGSDQLAPIEQEGAAARKKAAQPAQKSGTLQQQNKQVTGEKQQAVKAAQKKQKKSVTKKADKQKKPTRKKAKKPKTPPA
ncbi:MAG: hypothetical protein H7838_11790 [Magnetococcus sp. DMHC-8]